MKKRLLALLLMIAMTLSVLAACGGEEEAAEYPNDTLTIIVPWSVGGGVDVIARKFAQIAEQYYGQPIIVENHTGASGTVAMKDTMEAESDGYTMTVMNGPLFSLTPEFVPVEYTLDDVTPLMGMRTVPFVLLSSPEATGIESLDDLKTYAEGKVIKFATSGGPGNDQWTMAMSAFELMGIEAEAVAYDGQAEQVNALVGGHVDLALSTPPTYYEHERAGTIKGFATLAPEAVETEFGTVPTFLEYGIEASFLGMDYFAVKSDVPEEVKAKLLETIEQTYADEEFVSYMEELQFPIWDAGSEEILELIAQQTEDMKVYIELLK